MSSRVGRAGLLALWCAELVVAQASPGPATLKITGAVSTPLTLTVAQLKSLLRTTLRVVNPHEKKQEPMKAFCWRPCCRKPALLTERGFAAS
jgi:DMSO/TMAO reductase YedYZ molybdopterin-dependent catalytic subunit